MKNILTYLVQLGFSMTEAKLYITLLKSGPLTVSELADLMKTNRTTMYNHVHSLLKKGLIHQSRGVATKIEANPPDHLGYLLDQKVGSVKILQDSFPSVVNGLNTMVIKTKSENKSEMKYYKGRSGAKAIYDEALKTEKLRSYVNISIMNGIFPENRYVFKNAVENNKKLTLYEIFEDSPAAREAVQFQSPNKRFQCKYVPKDVQLFAADTLIYDGKVAIINVGDKNNITGVTITNADYYNNSVQLFDLLWRFLPEPK